MEEYKNILKTFQSIKDKVNIQRKYKLSPETETKQTLYFLSAIKEEVREYFQNSVKKKFSTKTSIPSSFNNQVSWHLIAMVRTNSENLLSIHLFLKSYLRIYSSQQR